MVRLRRQTALLFPFFFTLSLVARSPTDYQVGDRVEEDIRTPVALDVVDEEASEAVKRKTEEGIPAVFRWYSAAADDAENELRKSMAETRSRWLAALEQLFKKKSLVPADLESKSFADVFAEAKKSARGFPLTTNLAVHWALGQPDRTELATFVGYLREAVRQPVRDAAAPAGFKLTTRVRIIPVTDLDEPLSPADVQARGQLILRSEAVSIERARAELRGSFPPEQRDIGSYLASLLKPNCFLDVELTAKCRTAASGSQWVSHKYEPGQLIARKGQTVDAKMLAAIAALHNVALSTELKQQSIRSQEQALVAKRGNNTLLATGATLVFLSGVLGLVLMRRYYRARSFVQRASESVMVDSGLDEVRSGMLAEFSRLMREKAFRGLVSQREEMLDAQQSAAAEMAELDRRLNEVHAPLQERLRAYELRIGELERALAAKGAENRELLKAKIAMVRNQLAAERARGRLDLN